MIVRLLLLIQSGQSALALIMMVLELAVMVLLAGTAVLVEIAGSALRHRVELHVLFEEAGARLLPHTPDAARFVTDAVKAAAACLLLLLVCAAWPVRGLLHAGRRGFDLGWYFGGDATAPHLLLLKLITTTDATAVADIPVACVQVLLVGDVGAMVVPIDRVFSQIAR